MMSVGAFFARWYDLEMQRDCGLRGMHFPEGGQLVGCHGSKSGHLTTFPSVDTLTHPVSVCMVVLFFYFFTCTTPGWRYGFAAVFTDGFGPEFA